jgi:hypothetical protein
VVSAPTADRHPSSPGDDGSTGRSGWSLALSALAGAALAASFGVWIYAYSGTADREPPDLLSDQGFARRAERACAAALDEVADLPGALDASDEQERAEQIRASTDRFATMVDELDRLVDGDDRDVQILSAWLDDWRVVLDDRYRYADALEADPDAQFYLTDTGVGERLDRRITRLADTNAMHSCGIPTDVG